VSSRVLISIRVKATPQRAFEAFTREIGAWWKPNALFNFTPRSPGVPSFEGGEGGRFIETLPNGQVFEVGTIRVWRPGERLVFGWRCAWFEEGQDTKVEVRFEAVGDETRVTVEHSGWDSVPRENAARHGFPTTVLLQREAEWWRGMLPNLGGE
jgi:uncharacterized protein YndB with AHSA1/START domain